MIGDDRSTRWPPTRLENLHSSVASVRFRFRSRDQSRPSRGLHALEYAERAVWACRREAPRPPRSGDADADRPTCSRSKREPRPNAPASRSASLRLRSEVDTSSSTRLGLAVPNFGAAAADGDETAAPRTGAGINGGCPRARRRSRRWLLARRTRGRPRACARENDLAASRGIAGDGRRVGRRLGPRSPSPWPAQRHRGPGPAYSRPGRRRRARCAVNAARAASARSERPRARRSVRRRRPQRAMPASTSLVAWSDEARAGADRAVTTASRSCAGRARGVPRAERRLDRDRTWVTRGVPDGTRGAARPKQTWRAHAQTRLRGSGRRPIARRRAGGSGAARVVAARGPTPRRRASEEDAGDEWDLENASRPRPPAAARVAARPAAAAAPPRVSRRPAGC